MTPTPAPQELHLILARDSFALAERSTRPLAWWVQEGIAGSILLPVLVRRLSEAGILAWGFIQPSDNAATMLYACAADIESFDAEPATRPIFPNASCGSETENKEGGNLLHGMTARTFSPNGQTEYLFIEIDRPVAADPTCVSSETLALCAIEFEACGKISEPPRTPAIRRARV